MKKYPVKFIPVQAEITLKKGWKEKFAKEMEQIISDMVAEGYAFWDVRTIQTVDYLVFRAIEDESL